MLALPPGAGMVYHTTMARVTVITHQLLNYEVAPAVLRRYSFFDTLLYEKLSPLTSHGQICALKSKI